MEGGVVEGLVGCDNDGEEGECGVVKCFDVIVIVGLAWK